MGRTRKNEAGRKFVPKILEVTRNADGTYEIFCQGKHVYSRVQERWLNDELCCGYGFCGEEYDAILRQLNASGKSIVEL